MGAIIKISFLQSHRYVDNQKCVLLTTARFFVLTKNKIYPTILTNSSFSNSNHFSTYTSVLIHFKNDCDSYSQKQTIIRGIMIVNYDVNLYSKWFRVGHSPLYTHPIVFLNNLFLRFNYSWQSKLEIFYFFRPENWNCKTECKRDFGGEGEGRGGDLRRVTRWP